MTPTAFEAVTWAVIGQQINLRFAIELRNTLIRLAGRPHSSGLWCYPEPADVAALEPAALQARKYSRAKAETLIRLAQLVAAGSLPLEQWRSTSVGAADVQVMERELLAIKGIGPWTVNYVLLRGFGVVDCSLHGDAAVRNALQRLLGGVGPLGEAAARAALDRYRPYRSYAAAHLWASLTVVP